MSGSLHPRNPSGVCLDALSSRPSDDPLEGDLIKKVVNAVSVGVLLIEKHSHTIVDANEMAVELIGAPKSQILGRVCHRFVCPSDMACCPVEQEGEIHRCERVLLNAQGRQIPILKTVIRIEWQGRDYYVESFMDITDQKTAQQKRDQLLGRLEAMNRELRDFAHVVSHDLKAPLRGIKVLAEWVVNDHADRLGEEGREQLLLLQNRVDRMQDLIDGILQYSRIGRICEEMTVVDLNHVVAEIIDLLVPPNHIEITIQGPLPTLVGEKTRISQVFQNLLSNAIKYMDKPRGDIQVTCRVDGEFYRFGVQDNGPGIEEKDLGLIFRLFQTLRPKDEYESSGIGLTVVKKIVELYGGRIWVESKVGTGSTFYFTLPRSGPPDRKYETEGESTR